MVPLSVIPPFAWWPSIRLLPGVHAISCALATMISLENFSQLSGCTEYRCQHTQGQQITADRLRFKQIAPGFFSGKDICQYFS